MTTTQLPSELARLDEPLMRQARSSVRDSVLFGQSDTFTLTPGDGTLYIVIVPQWDSAIDLEERWMVFGTDVDMQAFKLGHVNPYERFTSRWKCAHTGLIAAWLFGDLT